MRAWTVELLGVCCLVAVAGCKSKVRNFGTPSVDGGHFTAGLSSGGAPPDGTTAPSTSGLPGAGAAQGTGGVPGNAPATAGGNQGGDAGCHECSSGDTRCVDDQIAVCELQGGCWVWGTPAPCPEGCLNAAECTTCTDACSLAATACSDGELRTCGQGPQGCSIWLAPTPCSSGSCLDDESCFACEDQCETGETVCSEGELSRCEEDAMGCLDWAPGTPCETGVCTTPTACAECNDVCAVGDTTCEAGVLRKCVADAEGCLDWSSPTPCPTGACSSTTSCLVCDDECSGSASCQGRQLQTCVADANGCLAWSDPVSCPFVCSATTGTCTGTCVPNDARCDGLQPQVCDEAGSWQDEGSPCSFVCNDDTGACEGACVPDTRRCSGNQPQVCNDEGVWENDGAACGTCMQCVSATGTCAVRTGACNDNNACTVGEQCQANGQCSGGSPVVCTGADQCNDVGSCVPATGCPAPTVRTGSCDDDNVCIVGETCQPNGACGGGVAAAHTTPCGNNRYCDGNGGCACRKPSSWNMLSNPGFDGGLGSWTVGGNAVYVTNHDADGCTGSGSVLIDDLTDMVIQCVPGEPDTDYYFGFRFKPSVGSSGTAICSVFFLASGTPCDGAYIESVSATKVYETTDWSQGAGSAHSPDGTATVRLNCVAAASMGYYDQIYLSESSPGTPAF